MSLRENRANQCAIIADRSAENAKITSMLLRLEGFNTICAFSAGRLAELVEKRVPDLLICDIAVCNYGPIAAVRTYREQLPKTVIAMTLDSQDVSLAVDLVHAGAHHVFARPWDSSEFIHAINRAMHHLAKTGTELTSHQIRKCLTPREQDVFDLITLGMSNKEAGRALGISPRTVEVHRARVMEKLGASNTAELVRIAAGLSHFTEWRNRP